MPLNPIKEGSQVMTSRREGASKLCREYLPPKDFLPQVCRLIGVPDQERGNIINAFASGRPTRRLAPASDKADPSLLNPRSPPRGAAAARMGSTHTCPS